MLMPKPWQKIDSILDDSYPSLCLRVSVANSFLRFVANPSFQKQQLACSNQV